MTARTAVNRMDRPFLVTDRITFSSVSSRYTMSSSCDRVSRMGQSLRQFKYSAIHSFLQFRTLVQFTIWHNSQSYAQVHTHTHTHDAGICVSVVLLHISAIYMQTYKEYEQEQVYHMKHTHARAHAHTHTHTCITYNRKYFYYFIFFPNIYLYN